MTKPNPLNEQEQADLVAYLDGELGGEAARALETKLSLNPAARAEAESLKRTWGLLDYLPQPEPSPNFTHRTLEKMAPIRTTTARPIRRPSRRPWLIGAGWTAAVLAAAAAGYIGVGMISGGRDSTDRDLTRDLRVIENKRFYDHVDDLDFLKSLDQPDLFEEDANGS
jgi:anti-sigma factor RsiW